MDEFHTIDIEGKHLACSTVELQKLITQDGCTLTLADRKVYKLDDNSPNVSSDSEEDDDPLGTIEDELARDKFERLKRDYLSIMLQEQHKIPPNEVSEQPESRLKDLMTTLTEKGDSILNNMYANLGDYEENIKGGRFVEISPGRVYKQRLVPGLQTPIQEDSVVIYNCALFHQKQRLPFDSSFLRQKAIVTDLASDAILPGIYDLLLTMKKCEWAEAYIRPEAAFGKLGAMPRIPGNATIFCVLQVVSVADRNMQILSRSCSDDAEPLFKDLYEAANRARMQGNWHFSKSNFKAALNTYKTGMRLLEACTYKDEKEENEGKELTWHMCNNFAKAANACKRPRLALSACKDAIELFHHKPNPYYHKIKAWAMKGHLDRALKVATDAMRIFGNDRKVYKKFQSEAAEIRKRLIAEEQGVVDTYRKMARGMLTS